MDVDSDRDVDSDMAVPIKFEVLLVGVLIMRALLFGFENWAPDFGNLPYSDTGII